MSDEMERPKCGTCPYWERDITFGDIDGLCFRHAPRPAKAKDREDDDSEYVYWPITLESEWCGEHPDFAAHIEAKKREAKIEASRRGPL